MSSNDLIEKAESLPEGAVFHRCALQVNPFNYNAKFRGGEIDLDEESYARKMVDKAVALGISVLAITDHNNAECVAAFRDAASGRPVYIFPGFEIASHEGIHTLCVYPMETEVQELGLYLRDLGVKSLSSSSDLSSKTFSRLLEVVRSQGGLTIAPHVTNESGLLTAPKKGQPRVEAWRAEHLMAIAIPGQVQDLPLSERRIVQNQNPQYSRSNPVASMQAVAVVNARDVATPEQLEHPSATCRIKMSEVSIEGLRQAFLDPGSRIRLNHGAGALSEDEHTELVAMAWEGGFLDGCAIHFNPNLNVLVGGRGAGKSTIIESIRAVLGLDALGDDARLTHEGFLRRVLRNGTRICLSVRVRRPAAQRFTVERVIPNPPVVRDENGDQSSLMPAELLTGLEVYGQHEISELTRRPEKLTLLLERFCEQGDETPRRRADLRRALEKNRRALVELRTDQDQIEQRVSELSSLEATLRRYQKAGVEDRLKDQSLLVREERIIAELPERMSPFRECLALLEQESPTDRTFLSEKALGDLPGKEILSRANDVFVELDRALEAITSDLRDALRSADERVVSIRKDWEERKRKVQTAYERILRELQGSSVDGEHFISLRRQVEELRPLERRRHSLQSLYQEQLDQRQELLEEWGRLKTDEHTRLGRAASLVNRELAGKVQVEVKAEGDRGPLEALLRETAGGGRLQEAIARLSEAPSFSLSQLASLCRDGADALVEAYSITRHQAETLAGIGPDGRMQIEELELPATTTIRLNTAPPGEEPEWRALDQLSTGQKATAVLLLLLLESDAPLIVDQPEDDLDNRFISDGIVPRMREAKQRRQFILSTHNANIPVLGDAEQIVGLSASGEADGGSAQIQAGHRGSIDSRSVRELVEEVLEGGKDAFERRRRKYGF